MAVWTGTEVEFCFAQNLSVLLFYHPAVMRDKTHVLASLGYHVVQLDCSVERNTFHTLVAEALHFPSYYGRNMDALNDCMRDVATRDYGVPMSATGLVIALWHIDQCDYADSLLSILWFQSLYAALFGNRMLVWAQTSDPHFGTSRCAPHGVDVLMEWNPWERRMVDRV